MSEALDREVDANFESFQSLIPALIAQERRGEFVLMRHGEIVTYHTAEHLALAAGRATFVDGIYSVQEVTDRPVDLGFFSHAIHPRIA